MLHKKPPLSAATDAGVIPTKKSRSVTLNNLFQYSTKELTTDAFLAWLFKGFDTEATLKDKGSQFFYELGLVISSSDTISCITTPRQEKNTDLILRCEVNGKKHQYLFENKTYSTIHSNQLKKYKSRFPKCDKYIYLKLGLINYEERKAAKNTGYEVIGVEALNKALQSLRSSHFLIEHYLEFLENEYIVQQRYINTHLIPDNKFKFNSPPNVDKGQEQQFFLSMLHQKLDSLRFKPGGSSVFKFKYGANKGGSPWVQLTIAKRDRAYGDKGESIFWRIDRRENKKLYLRLTQYSNIEKASKDRKYQNRDTLRKKVSALSCLAHFKKGRVINNGTKSSEIIIFFFDENDIGKMLKYLPELSREIVEMYDLNTRLKKWV